MNENKETGYFSSDFPNMHLFDNADNQVTGLFGPESRLWLERRHLMTRAPIVSTFLLILSNPIISSYKPFFERDSAYVLERAQKLSIYSAHLIYGDLSSARKAALELWEAHKRVSWEVNGKKHYPLQPDLMVWTWSCIYFIHRNAMRLLANERDDDVAQKLYSDFLLLGEAFGILRKHMPETLNDFEKYWENQLQSTIDISQSAQDACNLVFKNDSSIINLISKANIPSIIRHHLDNFIRLITLKLLPQTVLSKYKLSYNEQQDKSLKKYLTLISFVMNILPKQLKYKRAAIAAYERCKTNV